MTSYFSSMTKIFFAFDVGDRHQKIRKYSLKTSAGMMILIFDSFTFLTNFQTAHSQSKSKYEPTKFR